MRAKTIQDELPKKAGRPPKLREPLAAKINIRAIARRYGPDAIAALARIMMDEKIEPKSRVAAAREILDRGYGRATFYLDPNVEQNVEAKQAAIDELSRRITVLASRTRDPGAVGGLADS